MLKWLNFCPYISCQEAGLHNWDLLQTDRISLFYLSSELHCTLSASFSANLKEWTEGLSAQLGCKQKREAVCACIQFPCSYSSTFLITFLLNLLLKTPQKILFVSFLGKLIKIFWLLFFSLHAKPWNFQDVGSHHHLHAYYRAFVKQGCQELFIVDWLLQTWEYVSRFNISISITVTSLMRVFLKMLSAFSVTTLKTAGNKEQDGYESLTIVKSLLEEITGSERSPVQLRWLSTLMCLIVWHAWCNSLIIFPAVEREIYVYIHLLPCKSATFSIWVLPPPSQFPFDFSFYLL